MDTADARLYTWIKANEHKRKIYSFGIFNENFFRFNQRKYSINFIKIYLFNLTKIVSELA
jgi:hypothetical protein